ncbi:precorrin-6A reductase [Secundilactobacillus yichangensis]|uniref:precorrin-6A reductase n=1 Tax=Secundilactobacillus yichangensis TaxID=2799580 RepID=UPI001942363B|nr:precorrin-6A reductase [Secundilactobacillus yichangensis]
MILLLGGTSESLDVADYLTKVNAPFILSVTTDYGAELARPHAANISEQILTPATFHTFFSDHDITLIIDATHPFAKVISSTVMAAAQTDQIRYIRLERENGLAEGPNLKLFDDLDGVVDYLRTTTGTVYLSTGSKTAGEYAQKLGVERLHVRVLPTVKAISLLDDAGFEADQIDAVRGPFNEQLNIDLFDRCHAVAVVTKESGRRGGVQEKMAACEKLGIPCLVIRRPTLNYPEQAASLSELKALLEGTQ